MRCVMFQIQLADLLSEALGKGWEFAYADTYKTFAQLIHNGPVDLICWKDEAYSLKQPELSQGIYLSNTVCDAVNIGFGKSHRHEAEMLASGEDDFIVLPCPAEVLKVRLQNAIRHKAMLRSAREELWSAYAYRHSVLEHAIVLFEIDLDTGSLRQMKISEEAQEQFYPLTTFFQEEDSITRFHPDDRLMILDVFSAQGLRRMLAQGVTERAFEYRIRDKKGIWRWVKTCIHFEKSSFGAQRCFAYTKALRYRIREKHICEKILKKVFFHCCLLISSRIFVIRCFLAIRTQMKIPFAAIEAITEKCCTLFCREKNMSAPAGILNPNDCRRRWLRAKT